MAGSEEILRLNHVVKQFGGIRASDDVTFTVKVGDRVAIIGPNGAGKSTLFNQISCDFPPTSGEILYFGRSIVGFEPHRLVPMGVSRTFQTTSIFPSLTIMESLQLALLRHYRQQYGWYRTFKKLHREQAKLLINEIGLYKEKDDEVGTLSHGDKRLVNFAMALCSQPKLLLMDEPTQGMAAAEGKRMMEFVVQLVAKHGTTLLFTEHDMNVVFSVATSILVLHQGKVLAIGSPENIRSDERVKAVYLGGGH